MALWTIVLGKPYPADHDYYRFNSVLLTKSLLLGMKWANICAQSNFQPLDVVGRGSETQLHVGENLNKLT